MIKSILINIACAALAVLANALLKQSLQGRLSWKGSVPALLWDSLTMLQYPLVWLGAAAFLTVFRKVIFGVASPEALVLRPELAQGLNVAHQNAQAVSRSLFADYLLPFEILSVILLVALVGAVVLAKTERV